MEVIAGIVLFAILGLVAYSLCYSAGNADRAMEEAFGKAFVEKRDE